MPFSKKKSYKFFNNMKINLKKIKYYFLTHNNINRKNHILKEFKTFNLTEVNPSVNTGKNKSGASGFSKILDIACQNQPRDKPFQPFVIFEDDVKQYRDFPFEIDIPHDTDILYIGISSVGMNEKDWCNEIISKNINDNIVRIYNMLSMHGIMICSVRGLLAIQKCMLESYFKDIIWDIFTAQIQPYLNVYALKNPLVYQYNKIGGKEIASKINFIDTEDKELPNEWLNTDNVSIITNYNIPNNKS